MGDTIQPNRNVERVREIIERMRYNLAVGTHTTGLCSRCGQRPAPARRLCRLCLRDDLARIVGLEMADRFARAQPECLITENICLERAERLDQEAEAKDANQD